MRAKNLILMIESWMIFYSISPPHRDELAFVDCDDSAERTDRGSIFQCQMSPELLCNEISSSGKILRFNKIPSIQDLCIARKNNSGRFTKSPVCETIERQWMVRSVFSRNQQKSGSQLPERKGGAKIRGWFLSHGFDEFDLLDFPV
jgi:hypothetical protein